MVKRGIFHYFQDTHKTVRNACRGKACTAVNQLEFGNASFVTRYHGNADLTLGYTFLPTDKWRRKMNSCFLLIVFVYTIQQSIQKINQQTNLGAV